jgi:hypothetical protein
MSRARWLCLAADDRLRGTDMARDPRHEAVIVAATESAGWDARRQGLTVSFERILLAGDAAVASFVVDEDRKMVVWLEWTGKQWNQLGSTVLGPKTGGFQSFRPSEDRSNYWTVIAAGLAPAGRTSAVITLAGEEHAVPVVEGLYLFALDVEGELQLERLLVKLVE